MSVPTMTPLDRRPTMPQRGAMVARQSAYAADAYLYDRRTSAFQGFRRAIVDALPLRPGDTVLDVGCGTGLCFEMLLDRVGPTGQVIGIDASPEMIGMARARAGRAGWDNVLVTESPVAAAHIDVTADAALF